MRHHAFLAISLLVSFNLVAQQDYFIFIQSENYISFYAQVNNKYYNASAIGHLTIPGLKDSNYVLTIGFPKNQSQELSFHVNLNKRDRGFLLKKNGEKEWVLYDWKTPESVRSELKSMYGQANVIITKRSDAFAHLMASVVNDSDVLYTSVAKAEQPKVQDNKNITKKEINDVSSENKMKVVQPLDSLLVKTEQPKIPAGKDSINKENKQLTAENKQNIVKQADSLSVKAGLPEMIRQGTDSMNKESKQVIADNKTGKKDSLIIAGNRQTGIVDNMQKKDSLKESDSSITRQAGKNTEERPAVTKLKEQDVTGGKELVFIENLSINVADTVKIIIPFEKEVLKKEDSIKTRPVNAEQIKDTAQAYNQKDLSSVKAADSASQKTVDEKKPDPATKKDNTAAKKPLRINPDCRGFATEVDVDKLRVKMLAENNIDDRVNVARKAFKMKCYSYRQIRALTELFMTDEGRYKFFDAAYPFVFDTDNFYLLGDLLIDSYYINRFKVMLRL